MIDLYTTSECPKCAKLADFFVANKIPFKKKVIDQSPEDETDALMLNIIAAPAIAYKGKVLREKSMFKEGKIDVTAIMNFLKVADVVGK